MTKPLVSILVPVFNAGEYLRPAVKSVLDQTYRDLEIIIVDDGSTDDCIRSVGDLQDDRVRLLRQANAGVAETFNRAMELATGCYYAVQGADDLSHPRRIELQVHYLEGHPELAAVFTGWDLILNKRRLAPQFRSKSEEECRRDIESLRMPGHDATVMYRAGSVKGLRYETSLAIGEGFDYILRVGERFPMVVLGECLYSYRIHPNSLTQKNLDGNHEAARKILTRAAERRGTKLQENVPSPATGRRTFQHNLVTTFLESVLDLRRSGQPARACRTAWECLRLRPFDQLYYKPLVYALVPLRFIDYYRAHKSTFRSSVQR
jgi:glycosyltransferase involved in cell wall biosynthesis